LICFHLRTTIFANFLNEIATELITFLLYKKTPVTIGLPEAGITTIFVFKS